MKVLTKNLCGVALVGMMAAGSAQAQDGWYVSIGVGEADDDILETSDTAWKLSAGGYFSEHFGAEVGLVSLGSPSVLGIEFDQGGIAAFGLARLPLGENFDVHAKLGYFAWRVEASADGISASEDGTDFAWGLGTGYNFGDRFRLEAQYEQFLDLVGSDVDMLSVSAVYKFN